MEEYLEHDLRATARAQFCSAGAMAWCFQSTKWLKLWGIIAMLCGCLTYNDLKISKIALEKIDIIPASTAITCGILVFSYKRLVDLKCMPVANRMHNLRCSGWLHHELLGKGPHAKLDLLLYIHWCWCCVFCWSPGKAWRGMSCSCWWVVPSMKKYGTSYKSTAAWRAKDLCTVTLLWLHSTSRQLGFHPVSLPVGGRQGGEQREEKWESGEGERWGARWMNFL